MKPTTTPFPATLTNSVSSLQAAYEDLSKLEDKTALPGFWLSLNRRWNEAASCDFPSLSHGHQRPPERANSGAEWLTWLILGGRGAGKTRAGAEWVRGVAADPRARIALIGETEHDVREVMVEGVSGLLAVHRADERPEWSPARRRIEWQNGAVAQIFSAENYQALRGPQFSAAWLDELAKWRHADEHAAINGWRSPREPLDAFATFEGFQ